MFTSTGSRTSGWCQRVEGDTSAPTRGCNCIQSKARTRFPHASAVLVARVAGEPRLARWHVDVLSRSLGNAVDRTTGKPTHLVQPLPLDSVQIRDSAVDPVIAQPLAKVEAHVLIFGWGLIRRHFNGTFSNSNHIRSVVANRLQRSGIRQKAVQLPDRNSHCRTVQLHK